MQIILSILLILLLCKMVVCFNKQHLLNQYSPHKNCSTNLYLTFSRVRTCHCFCSSPNQHSFVIKSQKLDLRKHFSLMPSMFVSPWNASEYIVLSQPGHDSHRQVTYETVSVKDYMPSSGFSPTGLLGHFSLLGHCLDFRMFTFNNSLFLVCFQQNMLNMKWMAINQFNYTDDQRGKRLFSVVGSETPLRYTQQSRHEKNWGPFTYDQKILHPNITFNLPALLFEYSVNPHRILYVMPAQPGSRKTMVKLLSCTNFTVKNDLFWNPSSMRSGVPAVLLPNKKEYLSFFHVCEYYLNTKIKTYVMGAHTFEAKPPFAVTHVSPEPILAENFFVGGWAYKRLNYEIYPSQFLIIENKIVLSIHRNDRESWVVEMYLDGLLDSLQPVETTLCRE